MFVLSVAFGADVAAEELRSVSYELTHYTLERYFIPDDQDATTLVLATRVVVYEGTGQQKMRLTMSFHPAFNHYREAKATHVEKPHPQSSFFVLSAPVTFADQYLTLLSTGKLKRVEGTYDKSRPQGSSTITFATTKFRLLLEGK
ncbi:hypothetical protein [Thalassoroseus pseudoceratinae]|uniref:hypothetical protein n=1 Tax=Thalassoroseus pseudoceratinae TaxID=2713176 RepID=UPI00142069BA|nr:hypothetical protein [Thalassoroseus pseudoceratinae]